MHSQVWLPIIHTLRASRQGREDRKWHCVPAFIYDTVALINMGKQPTYQELLAAYNKLLIENQHLREKIGELQTLLGSKNNSTTPLAIERHLSLEEKAQRTLV